VLNGFLPEVEALSLVSLVHFQPIPCRLLCGRNIVLPQVFQIEDDVVQNNRFRIGQGFIESHSDPAIFSLTLRSFGN
jgi:hypothetical protein